MVKDCEKMYNKKEEKLKKDKERETNEKSVVQNNNFKKEKTLPDEIKEIKIKNEFEPEVTVLNEINEENLCGKSFNSEKNDHNE